MVTSIQKVKLKKLRIKYLSQWEQFHLVCGVFFDNRMLIEIFKTNRDFLF